MIILPIARLNPGKQLITDQITCIVGQLGAGAFHVDVVVTDVLLELAAVFRKGSDKGICHLRGFVVCREVADDVILYGVEEIVPGEVQTEWLTEICQVGNETAVPRIYQAGPDVDLHGLQIGIEGGRVPFGKGGAQFIHCLAIPSRTLRKVLRGFTERVSKVADDAGTG